METESVGPAASGRRARDVEELSAYPAVSVRVVAITAVGAGRNMIV